MHAWCLVKHVKFIQNFLTLSLTHDSHITHTTGEKLCLFAYDLNLLFLHMHTHTHKLFCGDFLSQNENLFAQKSHFHVSFHTLILKYILDTF